MYVLLCVMVWVTSVLVTCRAWLGRPGAAVLRERNWANSSSSSGVAWSGAGARVLVTVSTL